jgi:hypothetical protein
MLSLAINSCKQGFFSAYSLHDREPSLHLQATFLQIAGEDSPAA